MLANYSVINSVFGPVLAMKAYGAVGDHLHSLINQTLGVAEFLSFYPAVFCQGKESPLPLPVCGPQIQSGRLWTKKNLLPGIEPRLFGYSASSLVTLLATPVPAASEYWTMGRTPKPSNPM
jgi:hypothetical protein